MKTIKYTLQLKLLCFVFILLSANTWASNTTESEQKLLADIFPTSCHFSGQFSQRKNIDGLPVPLLSDGNFFFSCDLGLVWSTYSPFNEAILYANTSQNYRVNDEGEMQSLSGITQKIMSKILLRLLKGDADYFAEEFLVTPPSDSGMLELRPESYFMKKGIDNIKFKKDGSLEDGLSLKVVVTDTTEQSTEVSIDRIKEYKIDGKASAIEQCEKLYPSTVRWCEVLGAPRRSKKP